MTLVLTHSKIEGIMKKKIIITILFSFSVFVTTVSAQKYYFPGRTDPIETTFVQDSILFSELLSEFSVRCQQYDTLLQPEWYNPLNNPERVQLGSKYEKILMSVPFFKIYPAFRIDCPNGYVLGIYNHYINQQSLVNYLDLLSFDLKGRMISRISLAKLNLATYVMDDFKTSQKYQLISSTNIVNGEINYFVDQRSYISGEITTHSECTYLYKIQDDATLKLLSMDQKQN